MFWVYLWIWMPDPYCGSPLCSQTQMQTQTIVHLMILTMILRRTAKIELCLVHRMVVVRLAQLPPAAINRPTTSRRTALAQGQAQPRVAILVGVVETL